MIRKLLLSIALIFSVSAFADEATTETTNAESASNSMSASEFFEWGPKSNLAQLDLDSPDLVMDAVTVGRLQTNDDYLTNLLMPMIGTDNLPDWFVQDLKEQGFDKHVEQAFFFKWLDENRNYLLVKIFQFAGVCLLIWGCYRKAIGTLNEEFWKLISLKLVFVTSCTGLLFLFKSAVIMAILMGNGYANKFMLIMNALQNQSNYSTLPTASDRYNTSANSNAQTDAAIGVLKTRLAKLQFNMPGIADRDRWFVNIAGGYSVAEALAKFNEFQTLDINAQNEGDFNIDMTTSINNIVNLYKISRSVTIAHKTGEYSVDERDVYGHDSNYAELQINANAESFEQTTNSSVNDGTLIKQIQNVVDNSAASGGTTIINSANKAAAILIPAMQSGNVNSSTIYDDASKYAGLDELKTSIKSYAKKFAKEQVAAVNISQVGSMAPEARIALSGLVTSAVMAGVQGADKTGAATRNQFKYFLKIAEAQLNKECTEHYSEVRSNKVNVEKINAAMDQDAKKYLVKQGADIRWNCAFVRESDNTVIALGSEKPEDAFKYKAEVMGYKAAYDFAVLAFLEGVKEYINEDKTYLQSVTASRLRNLRLGLLGYALDGSARSRIQEAIAKRDAFISNAVHFTVNQSILNNPTKINTEDLWGAIDLKADKEKEKMLNEYFFTSNMQYAYLQAVVNLSANTPESDSSLSDKISSMINSIVATLLGAPTDSLKALMRSDPNLSIFEGAKACLKEPLVCYQRPKANLLAEVSNMGDELMSYSVKVYVINSVLHLAADSVDGVADLAENLGNGLASVGDKKGSGAIAKVLVGGTMKVVKFFISATISATEALKPIALILGGFGVFMKYVLPLLPAYILANILIKLMVNITAFQNLFGPYYIIRMLLAGNTKVFYENSGALINTAISLVVIVGVYAFLTVFLYVAIDLIDVAPLLWHILGSSNQGIIGSIMAVVIAMVMCVFTVHSAIKNIYGVGEQIMAKFEYNSNVDKEIERVAQTIFDSRGVEAIRTASQLTNKAIDEGAAKRKAHRNRETYSRENVRDAAKQGQGLKSGNEPV